MAVLPRGRIAWLALLVCVAPSFAAFRVRPASGVLWSEDFRPWQVAAADTAAWSPSRANAVVSVPEAEVVVLRAGAGRSMQVIVSRRVPVQPAFPYLVLDVAGADTDAWAGLGVAVERRTLVTAARHAGRYVFDLRRYLPGVLERGTVLLALTLSGATGEGPGPATRVRRLALVAGTDHLDFDASARGRSVRTGDRIVVGASLAEPAVEAAVDLWSAGPPEQAFTLDGRPRLALAPATPDRRQWTGTVSVMPAAGALSPGAQVLARLSVPGRPPVWTTLPFDLAPGGAAPAAIDAFVVAAPPTIDGVLSEDGWAAAPAAGGFQPAGTSAAETELRVLAGPAALYLGVVAHGAAWTDARTLAGQPDRGADSLDLVVNPRGAHDGGFRLALNAEGLRLAEEPTGVPWRWATSRRRDGWSAEVELPLAALGLGQGAETTWGLTVTRHRRRVGANQTASWPAEGPGLLRGLPDLRPYLLESGPARVETAVDSRGLLTTISLPVVNRTGQPLAAQGRAELVTGTGPLAAQGCPLDLAAGAQGTLRWTFRPERPGVGTVLWRLDATAPPALRLLGRQALELAPPALALRWLTPAPGVRSEAPPAALRFEVIVPPRWPATRVSAELWLGDRLNSVLDAEPKTITPFRFDGPFAAGTYRVAIAVRSGSRLLGRLESEVVVAPGRPAR